MKSHAPARVDLDDRGELDEVAAPGGHIERLDSGHWFVEVGDVAVWLHSSRPITPSYERREPGKWEETRIEELEREVSDLKYVLASYEHAWRTDNRVPDRTAKEAAKLLHGYPASELAKIRACNSAGGGQ